MSKPATTPPLDQKLPVPVRPPLFSSLRVRLLSLVFLAVFPALALVFYNAVEQRHIGLENAKENAFRLVHFASAQHDSLVENARQLLLTVSQLRAIKVLDLQLCQGIFKTLMAAYPAYANLGLCDPAGRVVASGVALEGPVDLSDRSYFREATNALRFVAGSYEAGHLSPTTPSLNLAYPVLDDSSNVLGVVFATLDLDWVYKLHAEASLPEGSSFTVYDRNMVTLARYPDPQKSYVGQLMGTPEQRAHSPQRDHPDTRPIDRTMIGTGRDGIKRLYASTQLGKDLNNSVRLGVGIPVSFAHAESNRLLRRNLVFLGLVTCLALGAAWWGSNFFVLRQVHSLLDATQRLREGDLRARAGTSYDPGELGQLAKTFDEMASRLEKQFAERHRAEVALKTLNESLERRVAKRTRELERSNEELEQFAYVASHDLQEPLRMVSSYLGLLRQRYLGKLDKDADEFIGYALDGSDRMHRLIHDLLAYSRVQTKAQPFQQVPCDALLDEVLTNLQVAISESKVGIHRQPLPTVHGDPTQLTQLLQNLLSNAIKFRGDQPPEIWIQAKSDNGTWTFSIRDNGIGIDPRHFDRIFVIFQRLHTRQKYPGTGIGLSICKKIVERHGGRIWLTSAAGQGTTFFFTLPKAAETPTGQPDP